VTDEGSGAKPWMFMLEPPSTTTEDKSPLFVKKNTSLNFLIDLRTKQIKHS
jgi:hypothetical protein